MRVASTAAVIGAFILTAGSARAQTAATDHPLLHDLAEQVAADALRVDLTTLIGFGTRHTLSDATSETRGIGGARRWTEGRFRQIAAECGGCLTVQTPSDTVTGRRVPTPTQVVDVLAVQRGTIDPDRVIVISAHIDSRVSDVMNATDDAPGANDDGSGVVAVLEAARILSKHRFPATIVYAVLSGEEQGLLGGKILADHARAQGWRVEANLNNDIIGNSQGQNGVRNGTRVRVFSEGTRSIETEAQARSRRYNGGEVDSPSRNLARFIDGLADRYLTGFDVEMIYRTDRFGRGGDQVEMLAVGYPSVRITEGAENYDRQHQDLRTEGDVVYGDTLDGVDFAYLAQTTRLNVVTLAALASAPPPPTGVTIEGAVSPDTTLMWQAAPGAAAYRVWRRSTTDPQWRLSHGAGSATTLKLKDIVIDDWFFGVSAVSADGFESPVVFPGDAGAFVAPSPAAASPAP